MSEIRDEVEADILRDIRKEQRVIIKNFIRDREIAKKGVRAAKGNLEKAIEKLEEVSNMNVEEFKASKYYGKYEVLGNSFLDLGTSVQKRVGIFTVNAD